MLKRGIAHSWSRLRATQPAMQADVRHKVQSHRDTQPMFDTDRFRRHIEAAYLQMWGIFNRGGVA